MWDESGLYELPMLERHTDDFDSSLLPTPNTHNWKESGHCRDFGGDLTHALTCDCQTLRA